MFNIFKKKSGLSQESFNDWIDSLDTNNAQGIVAINFGIFETSKGFKVYLIGSKSFDVENDDWACNEDYVPKQKYLKEELTGIKDWQQAQTKISELVKTYLDNPSASKSILSNVQYITCGFDDGELEQIKTPN